MKDYYTEKKEYIKSKIKMKVCSLGTSVTQEDVKNLTDLVCEENPKVVIVPSFEWIKETLQDISLSLFHMKYENARYLIDELRNKCMDFVSGLITDTDICRMAQESIELRLNGILKMTDGAYDLLGDRKILASGEYISSILVAFYLKDRGVDAALLDSSEFMCLESGRKPDMETVASQVEMLTGLVEAQVYVIQSCLCKDVYGETAYFSKTCTDLYALYIAMAFHAGELILCSPLKGVYTLCRNNAYSLSYEEAESFISAGIRLISLECIKLASQNGVTIRLVDSETWSEKSIRIGHSQVNHDVKGVVARKGVDYVCLHSLGVIPPFQFLERSLSVFSKYKVPVYAMTSSSANISMAVELSMDTFRLIRKELSYFAEVVMEDNVAVVCVLGHFGDDKSDVEGKVISLLKDIPILMISYGSDDNSVSLVVREKEREEVLCIFSDAFLNTAFVREKNHHVFLGQCNAFIV